MHAYDELLNTESDKWQHHGFIAAISINTYFLFPGTQATARAVLKHVITRVARWRSGKISDQ